MKKFFVLLILGVKMWGNTVFIGLLMSALYYVIVGWFGPPAEWDSGIRMVIWGIVFPTAIGWVNRWYWRK